MKNIVLMCAGGMSTSIIMKNIKKAADAEPAAEGEAEKPAPKKRATKKAAAEAPAEGEAEKPAPKKRTTKKTAAKKDEAAQESAE